MNTNTRPQRFGMWLGSKLAPRDVWSPTLAIMNRVPSLRWVWTGRFEDARKLGPDMMDGFKEGLASPPPHYLDEILTAAQRGYVTEADGSVREETDDELRARLKAGR